MEDLMRNLLIACSLLFSAHAFSATKVEIQHIDVNQQDTLAERHYYNFGMQRVHSRSMVEYRVSNTGTTELRFQDARIMGIGYYAYHNCSGVIPAGGRCFFRIEYAPYFEGYHHGQFALAFDQGEDIYVDLSGQAIR